MISSNYHQRRRSASTLAVGGGESTPVNVLHEFGYIVSDFVEQSGELEKAC